MSAAVRVGGVALSWEVAELLSQWESPHDVVREDLASLRSGETREALLTRCLRGAENEDDQPTWGEYVDALAQHMLTTIDTAG